MSRCPEGTPDNAEHGWLIAPDESCLRAYRFYEAPVEDMPLIAARVLNELLYQVAWEAAGWRWESTP